MDTKVQVNKERLLDVMRSDPSSLAIVSKLIKSNNVKDSASVELEEETIDKTQKNVAGLEEIAIQTFSIFPEVESIADIVSASILAPKDMYGHEALYGFSPESKLPAEFTSNLLKPIKDYVEKHYRISEKMAEWIKTATFIKGSVCLVVLPENILDDIINGRMSATEANAGISEVIGNDFNTKPMGLLGSGESHVNVPMSPHTSQVTYSNVMYEANGTLSMESSNIYESESGSIMPGVEVTDNFNVLKLPKVQKKLSELRVSELMKSTGFLYKDTVVSKDKNKTIRVKDLNGRDSIGAALMMDVPADVVSPVHVPGDPSNHVAYVIAIDGNGNPLPSDVKGSAIDFEDLAINTKTTLGNTLLKKAKDSLSSSVKKKTTSDDILDIASGIIEEQMLRRIQNGVYGDAGIQLDMNINRMLLYRSLSGQNTRMLLIPAEYVTYITMLEDETGVGTTLLKKTEYIASLRAGLLVSKVNGAMHNSIPLTDVDVALSPKDPTPKKTMEITLNELRKSRKLNIPGVMLNPVDIHEHLSRLGTTVRFTGHPKIPQTTLSYERTTTDFPEDLDSNIASALRKQHFLGLWASVGMMDEDFEADFASTNDAARALEAKKFLIRQSKFVKHLTKLGKTILKADTNLRDIVAEGINSNLPAIRASYGPAIRKLSKSNPEDFAEFIMHESIDAFTISLPEPSGSSHKILAEEYSIYKDSLEDVLLEAALNDELSEWLGELGDDIDAVRGNLKAMWLRQWCADNGFMPEIAELTKLTTMGKPTLKLNETLIAYSERIAESLFSNAKATHKLKEKFDTKMSKLEEPEEEEVDEPIEEEVDEPIEEEVDDTDAGNTPDDDDDLDI